MASGDLTELRDIDQQGIAIVGDGTTAYYATTKKIHALTIGSKALADVCSFNQGILCMDYDGSTYLYVGLANGQIYRVTVATGAKTLIKDGLPAAVVDLYVSTHLYVTLAGGRIVKVALS